MGEIVVLEVVFMVRSFRTRSARTGFFLLRDVIVVRIEETTKGSRVIVTIVIIVVFCCWSFTLRCVLREEKTVLKM